MIGISIGSNEVTLVGSWKDADHQKDQATIRSLEPKPSCTQKLKKKKIEINFIGSFHLLQLKCLERYQVNLLFLH